MAETAHNIYLSRKATFEKAAMEYRGKDNHLVFWRLITFISGLVLVIYGLYSGKLPFTFLVLPLIVIFFLLVKQHAKIRAKIKYWHNLILINNNCTLRLSGKWTAFANCGQHFVDTKHPYSADLNVFGQGSLFQFINVATTFMGQEWLAKLLGERTSVKEIQLRQDAIRDLSRRLDWRQNFEVAGLHAGMRKESPEGLIAWAESRAFLVNKKCLPLIWLLPVITLTFIVLAHFRMVPALFWVFPFAAQGFIAFRMDKYVRPVFEATTKAVPDLERFSLLLKCIEEQDFQAELLVSLNEELFVDGQAASGQIGELSRLVDWFSLRYSRLLHFVVNTSIFSDLAMVLKLERWKDRHGAYLRRWLDVIGRLEALSSLAGMAHDNEGWVFPEVVDGPPSLKAESIGHPLISQDLRICNDVSLPVRGAAYIITGSNMSGKSTFLRSIGINLVLAYCGAPVCALDMQCSLMGIYTSMQIADNLEQGISTFYAELNRMKMIMDAASTGEQIVYLLDEVFKGTNSKDRIFAGKTIIAKLSGLSTLGLITTHDLELASLEREYRPLVKNYHFSDTIINDRITFDYRIQPGVSQGANALALMKLIGIEMGTSQ